MIVHGGRVEAAALRFPAAPRPLLDLSTGINRLAYTPSPFAADWLTRLPEPEAVLRLQAAAAEAYGARDPAMVVAAPGTQTLISFLPRLRRPGRVHVIGPTYAEHAACWRAGGHAVDEVGTLEATTDADTVVLCQPNNPDGRRFLPEALMAMADRLAARDGLLVVDEAFADLEAGLESLVPRLPHPALVILRSFGKTYGLAGLRLGFALAAARHAEPIRTALGPWAVSGPAIAIGCEALADRAWRQNMAGRLVRNGDRLAVVLAGLGWRPVGRTALFQLWETGDAERVAASLGAAGVLVRTFGEWPTWLRFGLPGEEAEWRRLEAALRSTR